MAVGKHSEVKVVCLTQRPASYFKLHILHSPFGAALLSASHLPTKPSKISVFPNPSWVLVSFFQWVQTRLQSHTLWDAWIREKSCPQLFSCLALPFLVPSERSFVELKLLPDSIKCMTWVSCCCLCCWGWTWLQGPRKPPAAHKTLIVLPILLWKPQDVLAPGSSAGEFILTSGPWAGLCLLSCVMPLSPEVATPPHPGDLLKLFGGGGW